MRIRRKRWHMTEDQFWREQERAVAFGKRIAPRVRPFASLMAGPPGRWTPPQDPTPTRVDYLEALKPWPKHQKRENDA